MKKPNDLVLLLEELTNEIMHSSVEVERTSSAVIHTELDTDEEGIVFTANECKLVFHSKKTVAQLCEAIGTPEEASLVLHEVELDDEVIVALERAFVAVDES